MRPKAAGISDAEESILERQFDGSPFAKQRLDDESNNRVPRQPTKLDIFDFDSTLFLSPLLSPCMWHPKFIGAMTTENYFGPGWWRDLRSLQLGQLDQLQKSGWQGFWNEDVVERARRSLADENTLTVVLTGRRYHPFHKVIPSMLKAKDLGFDMVCLRPDPELADLVTKNYADDRILYNVQPSVFSTTMDFKTSFMEHMFRKVPSLTSVEMWDDRLPHVEKFRKYFAGHRLHSRINYVPAVRPRYNPAWERSTVDAILGEHNEHLKALRVPAHISLVPVKNASVVQLDQDAVDRLADTFGPLYNKQAQFENARKSEWRWKYGERPVLFGDRVILHQRPLPPDQLPFGYDTPVDVRVVFVTDKQTDAGLVLFVELRRQGSDAFDRRLYRLPLYFRPSDNRFFQTRFEANKRKLPRDMQITVQGKVGYSTLLTSESRSIPVKRHHPDDDNDRDY
ncbi:hypothetical protein BCR43DRAFT_521819 [Syncephalastrum racemosum]|uniref:Swiss Army Knife RNA repair protein HAD domain-containing protein n=1 Tax=Syncephalastrum racemosum TaxID=13706 RepID=A0A1X2HNB7_SYNRA|nr:hypothetical protein BCR43DRAFT_521819 [Syncephalastrum racemosum]